MVAIWLELFGYLDNRGRAYVRLKKALYGCIESAKLWYDELKRSLESWGYVVNQEDRCVFNKLVSGVQSTLLLHVDDILCLSASDAAHKELFRCRSVTVVSGNDCGHERRVRGQPVDAEFRQRSNS